MMGFPNLQQSKHARYEVFDKGAWTLTLGKGFKAPVGQLVDD